MVMLVIYQCMSNCMLYWFPSSGNILPVEPITLPVKTRYVSLIKPMCSGKIRQTLKHHLWACLNNCILLNRRVDAWNTCITFHTRTQYSI